MKLETLARAACEAKGISPDLCILAAGTMTNNQFSSRCSRWAWEDQVAAVHAILLALREPDEEMVRVMCAEKNEYMRDARDTADDREIFEGAFTAAIDSILTETPAHE